MVGVKFDNKHSFDDYGLILSSKVINAPAVKASTVSIVGADSVLDLTEFFGEPKFERRDLSFVFMKKCNTRSEFMVLWSTIMNDLNGKYVKVVIDDDPDYYYMGRASMSYTVAKLIFTITIVCSCEPYKFKHGCTLMAVNTSQIVNLENLRKRVVPTIKTNCEVKLTMNEMTSILQAGEYMIPEFELKQGDNNMSVEFGFGRSYYREDVSRGSVYTNNGITWTVNADGSVSAKGTATADSYFHITNNISNEYHKSSYKLGSGAFKLIGCPSGGSTSTYSLECALYDGNTQDAKLLNTIINVWEFTNFTLDAPAYARVQAVVRSGCTVNTVFNPKIEGDVTFTYQEGGL